MTFFFPTSRHRKTSNWFCLLLKIQYDICHNVERCGSTLKLRIAFTKAGRSLSLLLLFPEYRSSGAKLKRVLRSPAVKEKREAFLRIKVPAEVQEGFHENGKRFVFRFAAVETNGKSCQL
eukprot:symbB.v1.2.005483.t1/scaffold320.1/size229511/2